MFSLTIPKRSRWLESPGILNNQLRLVVYPTIYTGFSTIQTVVNRLGISAIQQHPRGEGLVSRSGRWMPRHLLDGHEVEPRSGPSPNVYRNTGCRSEDGRPGKVHGGRWRDDRMMVSEWKRDPLKKEVGWFSDRPNVWGWKGRSRRLESPGLCLFFLVNYVVTSHGLDEKTNLWKASCFRIDRSSSPKNIANPMNSWKTHLRKHRSWMGLRVGWHISFQTSCFE